MAIIIPSKNIYELKNDKIIKNKVLSADLSTLSFLEATYPNNVFASYTTKVNKSDLFIEDGTYSRYDFIVSNKFDKSSQNSTEVTSTGNRVIPYAFCAIKAIYEDITIIFPQNPDPYSFNEGVATIENVKVVGSIITKDTTQKYVETQGANGLNFVEGDTTITTSNTVENAIFEEFPLELSVNAPDAYNYISASVTIDNEENITLTDITLNKVNNYEAKIRLRIGTSVWTSSGVARFVGSSYTRLGTITEYRPSSYEFNIMGRTFKLERTDNNKTILSGAINGTPISMSENALLQKAYEGEITERVSATLEQYSKGKETATALCSISNYNDENGAEQISIERNDERKMSFKLYDEVVPCVMNEYGADSPMSINADGLPKSFLVLGSEMIYDGSVMQRLSLQENRALDIIISDGTRGLSYSLSDSGIYWVCDGIGTATGDNIKIDTTRNGKVVTAIASGAFSTTYGDKSIHKVVIPPSIKEIGDEAFFLRMGLRTVSMPNSVERIGARAFNGCENLKDFNIPSNLEEIGDSAFGGCTKLTSVCFDNNLKTLGEQVFFACYGLKEAILPISVTQMGRMIFASCDNIERLTLPFVKTTYNGTDNQFFGSLFSSSTDYTANEKVPQSLKYVKILGGEIGESAFEDCRISQYELGENVTSIGSRAFANGGNYKLNIPESITELPTYMCASSGTINLKLHDNITSIGEGCFQYCYIQRDFKFPKNLKKIGASAFNGNTTLSVKSLIIPDSVTYIGRNAFHENRISKSLKISNNLKKLEASTFSTVISGLGGSASGIEIDLGKSLEYISENVFSDSSAGKVTFHEKLNYIGTNAFKNTQYLYELIFKQPSDMSITLPTAGSSTGAFYYKNSRNIIIRTDNHTIKNYDWTADNVVPIFYHLDGTAWE